MKNNNFSKKPIFIDEMISVYFDRPGFIIKKPECPDKFTWRGETYVISELLNEWQDFTREEKFSINKKDTEVIRTAAKSSLNVGRFYFRVRTTDLHIFDLYFDRSIKNVFETRGFWVIYQEVFLK